MKLVLVSFTLIYMHTLSAACALVVSFYINVWGGGGLHVLREALVSHCLSCHVVFLSFLAAKTA